MRFIAELKDEELLPIIYDISEDISDFVKTTKILDIRKKLPKNGVTADEQGRENVKEMLKVICKEHPTETANILKKLWVCETVKKEVKTPIKDKNGEDVYDEFGEQKFDITIVDYEETDEDKPNFIVSLSKLLAEKWLIDFFMSAVNLM